MAHEISVLENGLVEACYANKPAWHKLGHIFDLGGTQGMTSAIAARQSNMDAWTVAKQPIYTLHNGEYKLVPSQWGICRSDNGNTLGIVGDTYVPFQNHEAFSFLDSLVMDGILRYEAAIVLRGGAVISLLARMPGVDTFAEGDHGLRYILLSAGHDGNTPINLLPTGTRVVCANTWKMALQAGRNVNFSIKHTGKAEEHLRIAKQFISQFDKGFTLFRDKAQLLATRSVSLDQRRDYLETLFPTKGADGKPKEGRGLTIRDNKVGEILAFGMNKANTLPSMEGTWWGLWNSLTMAVDHGEKFTSRGSTSDGGRAFEENKFLSLMDGGLATLKDEAFDLACEMAGVTAA